MSTLNRAIASYRRSGGTAEPSADSGEQTINGKAYVVLRNVNGALAVFRLRANGALYRLRRWPNALNASTATATWAEVVRPDLCDREVSIGPSEYEERILEGAPEVYKEEIFVWPPGEAEQKRMRISDAAESP